MVRLLRATRRLHLGMQVLPAARRSPRPLPAAEANSLLQMDKMQMQVSLVEITCCNTKSCIQNTIADQGLLVCECASRHCFFCRQMHVAMAKTSVPSAAITVLHCVLNGIHAALSRSWHICLPVGRQQDDLVFSMCSQSLCITTLTTHLWRRAFLRVGRSPVWLAALMLCRHLG